MTPLVAQTKAQVLVSRHHQAKIDLPPAQPVHLARLAVQVKRAVPVKLVVLALPVALLLQPLPVSH